MRRGNFAEIQAPSRLGERRPGYGDKSTETDAKRFDTKECQTLNWHEQPFYRSAVGYTNVNSCQSHRLSKLKVGKEERAMAKDAKGEEEESEGDDEQGPISKKVRITCPTLRYGYNDDFTGEDEYDDDDDGEYVECDDEYLTRTGAQADRGFYRNADDNGQDYICVDEDDDEAEVDEEETTRPDFRRMYSPRASQDFLSPDDIAERSNYLRNRVMNDKLLRYDNWGTPTLQRTFRHGRADLARTLFNSDNCRPPPTQTAAQSPAFATRQKSIPLTPKNTSYCRGKNLHLPTAQTRDYRHAYVPLRRFPAPSERFGGRCLLSHRGAV
ncbi:hypothetical protein SprV_0502002900 [Sparganum proliferum]